MDNQVRKMFTGFGFKHLPFTREIAEPYLDERREKALKMLREFLQFRGFAVVSGEPGTGKTMLLKHLCAGLPGNSHKIIYIPFSTLSDSDMLKTVCFQLGVESTTSRSKMFKAIQKNIEDMQPVNPILVIDEAQKISHKTMETIRLMANFYFEDKNFFSVIMAGTEDFVQLFRLRVNQSLLQRITLFCSVAPLSREQTAEYVAHHFREAGVKREIVNPQAVNKVHDAASGIPRLINNLMLAALRETAEDGKDSVELEHVRKGMINSLMPAFTENEQ